MARGERLDLNVEDRMRRIGTKLVCLALALCLLFCLTSCGQGSEPEQTAQDHVSNEAAPSADNTAEQEDGSKSLVVYFSRTGEQYTVGVIDKGNTAIVAEMIADETGADLFELVPADDQYPMTYAELTDIAKQEQRDNARPEYAGEMPDLSQYGTIFIGAPVWWGDWPMILYTFFENNADALAGKTLVPFSTHEGSGLSGFDKKLAKACPDAAVEKGIAVRGNDCQNRQDSVREDVSDWLGEFGY
uniref:Flavodoxin n=1 Tax=uncultured bacterium Contig1522a TaxID=1393448 RepID=W0FLQ8_9BACT|nr:flavodoxin [uncultured bacterium Contig1522a]